MPHFHFHLQHQDRWIRPWWFGIWPQRPELSALSVIRTSSLGCIFPPLVTWWPLHPKTEPCDYGNQPCKHPCMALFSSMLQNKTMESKEGGCRAWWRGLLSTCLCCCDMCLCIVEKESQRSSKLIPLLCEVLLSPMTARDWRRPLTTSPSKCGAFPATASCTPSTSTPTGCAVPGGYSRSTPWNIRGDGRERFVIEMSSSSWQVFSRRTSRSFLRRWPHCQVVGHVIKALHQLFHWLRGVSPKWADASCVSAS